MAWVTVAEGVSFAELRSVVGNMELPKGTKVKVVMDLKAPVGWAFDAPGAELLFRPVMPSGMKLIDVYGGGRQGIVEMEADPAWLVAVLAFIKANWVAILIAGLVIGIIVFFIRVMIQITEPGPFGIPWWVWLVGGAAIAVPLIMSLIKKPKKEGG